jgi:tetratricopeptide (TPR) repeat protein
MNNMVKSISGFLIAILLIGCSSKPEEIPLTAEEHLSRAEQLLAAGNIDKAISEYRAALDIEPSNGTLHYLIGKVYYQKWLLSREAARRKYSYDMVRHPNKNPRSDLTEEELSRIYEQYGLDNALKGLAMDEFALAIKYDPNLWMARYQIATNALNEEHYDKAIEEYKKVIKVNPSYSNAYSLLGEAYFKTGDYGAAIEYLKKAIEIEPDAGIAYYRLGLVYLEIDDRNNALESLAKLKELQSSFYDDLKRRIDNFK